MLEECELCRLSRNCLILSGLTLCYPQAMFTRETWYEWYTSVLHCTMSHSHHKAFVLTLASLSTSLLDFGLYRKNSRVHR